jgi:hypothetical protein
MTVFNLILWNFVQIQNINFLHIKIKTYLITVTVPIFSRFCPWGVRYFSW